MYFSSIFPYVVLFCFLIRGLLLDGALEGITYMFYPKVCADKIWCSAEKGRQMWTVALMHVFFHAHPFLAGNLGGRAGVAAGSHTGLLRLRTWLWLYYCLLLLQSQEQQLPPWCLHCLHHKLSHVRAGHACRICRARLSCQRQSHRMCRQVCTLYIISHDCVNIVFLLYAPWKPNICYRTQSDMYFSEIFIWTLLIPSRVFVFFFAQQYEEVVRSASQRQHGENPDSKLRLFRPQFCGFRGLQCLV